MTDLRERTLTIREARDFPRWAAPMIEVLKGLEPFRAELRARRPPTSDDGVY